MNFKTHTQNSLFRAYNLTRNFANNGFEGVMNSYKGRAGADNLWKDIAAIGTIAAGGVIATRALGSINVASDDALNSAASAAGNLLGYRMTMNAMNLVPGLGV